jgi:hypothetical protein
LNKHTDTINSLKRDVELSEKKLTRSKMQFKQDLLGGLGEDIKTNGNFDGYYPVIKDNIFKKIIKWFTKN